MASADQRSGRVRRNRVEAPQYVRDLEQDELGRIKTISPASARRRSSFASARCRSFRLVSRGDEDVRGMADYQVRGWVGWHHHMAMVLMAMLFMLEQRIESGHDLPVTCSDIEWVLKQILPSRVEQTTRSSCFSKSAYASEESLSPFTRRMRKSDKVELVSPDYS